MGLISMKGKSHKLFLVVADEASNRVVCFHHIRKGSTVCIKKSRKTNHNCKRLEPKAGLLFSLKFANVILLILCWLQSSRGDLMDSILDNHILPELKEFVYLKNISDQETFAVELERSSGKLEIS